LVILWALLAGATGSPISGYVDFCQGGCIENMGVPQCGRGVVFNSRIGECAMGQFKDSNADIFTSLVVHPVANSSNYTLDFYTAYGCRGSLLQTYGPCVRDSCCPTLFSLGWDVVASFIVRNVTASPRGENAPIRLN
jgi:hypothetical protein